MSPARLIAASLACSAVLAGGTATAQVAEQETPAPDELVSDSELERQRKSRSARRNSNSDVDFVTITRNSTRSGQGSIRVRVQPYAPQREIRLRAADARQLAEGSNSRLELQPDRLTTSGAPIRSVTFEFTAGSEEADGLPALIAFNATTSLFNFDYARLENSTQPLLATLENAMDPETRRCTDGLSLGIGAEDFRDRFVLLGNRIGDCIRTVNSREGDLLFADAVPQRLRQVLRDLHDPIHRQLARQPGNEPDIVFVVWRPELPRDGFRLVRSLNGTGVLLLNGPSWESGIPTQQRESLLEAFAQNQLARSNHRQ